MDQHQLFGRAAIEQGIPEDEVSRFAEFLRFAIWTSPAYDGPPVGRGGGLPSLPVGMEWPSVGARPLQFVASFDCAALPRVAGFALPTDGSLLFFLDHERAVEDDEVTGEQRYARIVYVPAGAETALAAEPDHDEEMYHDSSRQFVEPEHVLFAAVAAELPRWLKTDRKARAGLPRSDDGEHLGLDLPHRAELRALVRELWPEPDHGAYFYLGGYTGGIGGLATNLMSDTPETDMAGENITARREAGEPASAPGEWQRDLEMETLRVMREWVPLVQFTPDSVHRGRFLIRHDDLVARRFEKALSFTAFTE
ncbi:DUF1963 domain-containing protein [Micromonospora sp. NPDC000663]|uniref:DUF1963 domain-containing protein n=1 Tax=Micromonospora sp. NPDC000663 TaxID=3364218 RepID=UPI0036B0EB0E